MTIEIHENANVRLKEAMQVRHLKAPDLARVLEVSEASAYRILAGRGGLSSRALAQIASGLHISPTWIVLGSGDMFLDAEPPDGARPMATTRTRYSLADELSKIASELREMEVGHHGSLFDLLASVIAHKPTRRAMLEVMLEGVLQLPPDEER